MKKTLAMSLVLLSLFSLQSPAQAAQSTIKIGTSFTASFENKIKYGGKDCLKIKFKYKVSGGLGYPNHVITLGLNTKKGDDAGGFLEFKVGSGFGGGEPYSGYRTMQLCQSTQSVLEDPDCDEEYQASVEEEPCEYEEIASVKPGSYFLQSTLTQIRPSFSIKSSNKVNITIGK